MQQASQLKFQGSEALSKYESDLIREGLLSQDQLAISKITQENLGQDLGSVMIKKGFVTEAQLLEFLAKRLGIPYITLKDNPPDPDFVHKIPLHIAKQHHAIPLGLKNNKVIVAMANPFDSFARDDLKEILKSEIEVYLVSSGEIQELLHELHEKQAPEDKGEVIELTTEQDAHNEASETRKMQEMALGPKIVAAVNNLIAKAHAEKASDIHVEPGRDKVKIRYRVDGLLRERGSMPTGMHLPVISRIKILANLDIAEKRVPQDGRIRIKLVGKPLDLRISTCPTQHGEKVVIRLLSKDNVQSIESMGFETHQRHTFSDIISKSHGIFLSTGPTGSGKSTTLYAALARLNSSEKNIISIEDPIENEIEGVNQVHVNTKTGLSFASVLRSVLRQDPDVIMIGEIRDAETAQIAVRAAITGHMVLSTLHTNTAAGAISRLQDLGVESFLLASALKGLMAQRLVRRICSQCREEVDPKDIHLKGIQEELKKAFQGKGCPACHYSGYRGRLGIFELAAVDENVRQAIHHNQPEEAIVEIFKKNGVKSIVRDGLDKVEQGLTTVEEVLRVTQED